MQFHEYMSAYTFFKNRMKPHGRRMPAPADWYKDGIRSIIRSNPIGPVQHQTSALMQMHAESEWWKAGQPYYKIFPAMAHMMAGVSIDIPSDVLRMPYPTFSIQLADDDSNQLLLHGERVLSLLVHLFSLTNNPLPIKIQSKVGTEKYLLVAYQTATARRNIEHGHVFQLGIKPDDPTLNFSLERAHQFSEPGYDSEEIANRIIRLAVACCFFGIDRHEVVLPDLPRKVIERRMRDKKCLEGPAIKELSDEVKDRGEDTKKWTIGREISLPYPLVKGGGGGGNPDSTGRARTHAYMVRGHMRYQPYGEGRKLRKLIFIHPHICKPDLPFAPTEQPKVGYAIPDPTE